MHVSTKRALDKRINLFIDKTIVVVEGYDTSWMPDLASTLRVNCGKNRTRLYINDELSFRRYFSKVSFLHDFKTRRPSFQMLLCVMKRDD